MNDFIAKEREDHWMELVIAKFSNLKDDGKEEICIDFSQDNNYHDYGEGKVINSSTHNSCLVK